MSHTEAENVALDVEAAMQATSLGRTKLYAEINAGRLKARKIGTKTIVLRKDLIDYLDSLPAIQPHAA